MRNKMSRILLSLIAVIILAPALVLGQELFIFSDVAANVAKGRKQIDFLLTANKNIYFTNSYIGIRYGTTGQLTTKAFIRLNPNTEGQFFGDPELENVYRFYSNDSKNYHLRMAFFNHVRFPSSPANSHNPLLHQQATLPKITSTDNYSLTMGYVVTRLSNKFAVNLDISYNLNIPKGEFKYGNFVKGGISFGKLIFPQVYKNYDQTNLNLYLESKAYYFNKNKLNNADISGSGGKRLELMLGSQIIIKSTMLIELGYIYSVGDKQIQTDRNQFFTALRYLFF
jgi:hypothetical protein